MTNRAAALRARLVVLPDPQAQDAANCTHASPAPTRAQHREAQAYARYLAARNEIRCVERTSRSPEPRATCEGAHRPRPRP